MAHLARGPGVHAPVAFGPCGIVGFSRLAQAGPIAAPPPYSAELTHLYVHPGAQAAGIGRRLMEGAIEIADVEGHRRVLLWVLEGNQHARRFYERFGFVYEGARRTDPELLGGDAAEARYVIELPRAG